MVLKIRLGKKREKRLQKHLEKEHPSTKGKTSVNNFKINNHKNRNRFSTEKQIDRILNPVPNFECQLNKFTQI